MATDDPYALLTEWLAYWQNHDEMPGKMPKSLHVRTAIALTVHKYESGEVKAIAKEYHCNKCYLSYSEVKAAYVACINDGRHSWKPKR